MQKTGWATRIGALALLLALAAAGAMFIGATVTRYSSGEDKLALFGWVPLGFQGALLALAVAVVAIVWRLVSRRGTVKPALIALLVAGVPATWLASQIADARELPMIHDATTDPVDLPQFAALEVETPSVRGLDGGAAEWRRLHEDAYGDLEPLVVPGTVPDVAATAAELLEQRGWEVADTAVALDGGRIEATATVSYYRFKDDVVLRFSPNGEGAVRVDMRSVSRVGLSDLGYNAQRIRDFLADLRGAVAR